MSSPMSASAMPQPQRGEITQLLDRIQDGDRQAISQLASLAFPELRRLAAAYLRRQPPGHTWMPTDLVNELWVRLLRRETLDYQNHGHFLGAAAHLMRSMVIDHARHRAARRSAVNGTLLDDPFDHRSLFVVEPAELLALGEALARLALRSERQARVVELRYFAGFTVEETAEVLGVSPKTVKREWATARAWLHAELRQSRR